MRSNVTFSTLLVALLSAALVSTPSFADRDGDRDGYSDNHDDRVGDRDNHNDGSSGDNHRDRVGDRSYGGSTKTKLKARLFSTVQAGARGEVELKDQIHQAGV